MSVCTEGSCARVIAVETKVEDLKGWQKSQNGAIHDVNGKVDKLLFYMMGTAIGAALSFLGTIITLLTVIFTSKAG